MEGFDAGPAEKLSDRPVQPRLRSASPPRHAAPQLQHKLCPRPVGSCAGSVAPAPLLIVRGPVLAVLPRLTYTSCGALSRFPSFFFDSAYNMPPTSSRMVARSGELSSPSCSTTTRELDAGPARSPQADRSSHSMPRHAHPTTRLPSFSISSRQSSSACRLAQSLPPLCSSPVDPCSLCAPAPPTYLEVLSTDFSRFFFIRLLYDSELYRSRSRAVDSSRRHCARR